MKVYCASKSKYAPMWLEWKARGVEVTSSWLEHFDEGCIADQTTHWEQIKKDIENSDALLLYS